LRGSFQSPPPPPPHIQTSSELLVNNPPPTSLRKSSSPLAIRNWFYFSGDENPDHLRSMTQVERRKNGMPNKNIDLCESKRSTADTTLASVLPADSPFSQCLLTCIWGQMNDFCASFCHRCLVTTRACVSQQRRYSRISACTGWCLSQYPPAQHPGVVLCLSALCFSVSALTCGAPFPCEQVLP